MTPEARDATPPGWYEDAHDPRRLRYWDGSAWLEEYRPKESASGTPSSSLVVAESRVCTTDQLPGYTIVRVLGIVSDLGATSTSGSFPLFAALSKLRVSAGELGANAIVGLTGGPFGARGGISSQFGGNAIGIFLMGTAVVVGEV